MGTEVLFQGCAWLHDVDELVLEQGLDRLADIAGLGSGDALGDRRHRRFSVEHHHELEGDHGKACGSSLELLLALLGGREDGQIVGVFEVHRFSPVATYPRPL
jgi:hypothetical protein